MKISMKAEGTEKVKAMLKELGDKSEGIAKRGLYEGAGVIADRLKDAAGSIKTEEFHGKQESRKPSPEEKAIVESAKVGIAKFRTTRTKVNTSIGYRNAGYATLGTKRVPIPKIVNAINSGTSFMPKQPFIRRAASKAKAASTQAIVDRIEADVNNITGGNK